MTDYGFLMAHEAKSSVEAGSPEQLRDAARATQAISDSLCAMMAKRMGMSVKAFKRHVSDKEWWLSSEDAVKFHAVDKIMDAKDIPPPVVLEKKSDISIFFR